MGSDKVSFRCRQEPMSKISYNWKKRHDVFQTLLGVQPGVTRLLHGLVVRRKTCRST